MSRSVLIPDLAEQLAEIVADPTAYVRRTRELAARRRCVPVERGRMTAGRWIETDRGPARCPNCGPTGVAG